MMEWLKALRVVEMCVRVAVASWVVPRLPSLLNRASLLLCTPLFVFLLSNAIIATLLLLHGHKPLPPHDDDDGDDDDVAVVVCRHHDDTHIIVPSPTCNSAVHDHSPTLHPNPSPHDNLSSEEFQRTVEAFIANQLRFFRTQHSY